MCLLSCHTCAWISCNTSAWISCNTCAWISCHTHVPGSHAQYKCLDLHATCAKCAWISCNKKKHVPGSHATQTGAWVSYHTYSAFYVPSILPHMCLGSLSHMCQDLLPHLCCAVTFLLYPHLDIHHHTWDQMVFMPHYTWIPLL